MKCLSKFAIAHSIKMRVNIFLLPSARQMKSIAHFSTRSMKRKGFKASFNTETVAALPEFQHLLRQLYRKSHPDLIRASHPELAEVNDSSMQQLNGILTTIKKYNEYPPQIVKSIPFHVRKGENLELVHLNIKTAGGDCRRSLFTSFKNFFLTSGVTTAEESGNFEWGKNYFPTSALDVDEDSDKDDRA